MIRARRQVESLRLKVKGWEGTPQTEKPPFGQPQHPPRATAYLAAILLMVCAVQGALWAESVDIVLPAAVGFGVLDIASPCTGSPNPCGISFSNAHLTSGKSLRISVIATADTFTVAGGLAISCSNLTWTTSAAVGGAGSSGRLSSSTYNQVYQSSPNPTSGSVDITWSLDPCGVGVFAGVQTLTLIWKVESVGG